MNTERHVDELFARLDEAAQDEVLRVADLEVERPPFPRESQHYRSALSEWMAEHRHALLPVMLRTRDWPDVDIKHLVDDSDLRIGEPTRVKGIAIRISLGMQTATEGNKSSQGGILLPDLAAASEALTGTFLALSAASRPLGQVLEPPEGVISKGSVELSLPGGLLSVGVALILAAPSGLITPPPSAYIVGAALTSLGVIDKWLEWKKKQLETKDLEDEIRDRNDDRKPMEGAFAHSSLVPRHVVQAEAARLGLTEECANHLLNRCIPIAYELRKRIPQMSIETLAENPLIDPTGRTPKLKPLPGFTDTLKDGTYSPEMVKIPGGTFLMGSPKGRGLERPQHRVTVKAFAIGKYPVTLEEFDKFARATKRDLADDYRWGRGRRPVINVDWEDAVKYTDWLSQETGKRYRLPTEAEWEYAARAGSQTRWSFGNEESDLGVYAWYGGAGGSTHPVGEKGPNPWGLFDVHGNVCEWVHDCWHDSYEGAPANGSAWEKDDGGDCDQRVVRGGSWFNFPVDLRSANRDMELAVYRDYNIGFRLAQDP